MGRFSEGWFDMQLCTSLRLFMWMYVLLGLAAVPLLFRDLLPCEVSQSAVVRFNMASPSAGPTAPRWRPRREKARTVDHVRAKGPVLRAAPRVTLGTCS